MATALRVVETPMARPMAVGDWVTLHQGDCRDVLATIEDESVHMVLTDPPYFLDGLDNEWRKGGDGPRGTGAIGGLPAGMKFDPEQGRAFQRFLGPVADELLRILKPGGFALMFSAPRLAHRATIALEDTGFEIRDQYVWRFTRKSQFKAFTMDHFVEKRSISQKKKKDILKKLNGRRTPQLRPLFESIICAQKPRHGTFVDNWLEHETGMIDADQSLDGAVPSTVMTVEKPERDKYNCHLTPKPVDLCEHLIRLFTKPGHVILDPFLGSGTTCLAAQLTQRVGIGVEVNPDYIEIARRRLEGIEE